MDYTFDSPRSLELMQRALEVTPGGVNSPVRAFTHVGGNPKFIARGEGAYIYDADGKKYLDYVGSWGPLILGHCAEVSKQAIREAVELGTSFGAPTEKEVEFAELLIEILPSVEQLRFVSSGTEATMSAIRLARAYTGREIIIKFDGCYHGHADSLLVKAGSGVAALNIPACPGIPAALASLTYSVPYNDCEALADAVKQVGAEKIAAIIIEPVAGNMGLVLPEAGYLQFVRELCDLHGIVLIADEVMTGFRLSLGGAQERFNFKADLSTYGKVIGAGLPVGAFGGRKEIMQMLAPCGSVYQAGTLSGNPLAMAAGLATVKHLRATNPYPALENTTQSLVQGLSLAASRTSHSLMTASCGSMFGFFFAQEKVRNFKQALSSDIPMFKRFFWGMLAAGVYLAPSAVEAGFVGVCHSPEDIRETVAKAETVMASLPRSGR